MTPESSPGASRGVGLVGRLQALELLAQERPLADVLEALCRQVEEAAGNGVLASVLLLDPDGVHLRHGAAPGLPAAYSEAIDGIEIGPAVGSCGTAAYRGEAVIVGDIAADPLWLGFRDLAAEHGLAACWSTPIASSGGGMLGTFAMYYRQPRLPGPADLELVAVVTRVAALAIERQRKVDERERLLAAERAARAEADGARQRLEEAERQITAAVSAGHIGVWSWDAVGDRVVADALMARLFALDVREAAAGVPLARVVAAIDERDRPRVEAAIAEALRSGESYDAEFRVSDAGGVAHWVRGSGSVQLDAAGKATGLVGVGIDVSTDVALRESDERFRTFVAATSDVVYRMSADWSVMHHLGGEGFIADTPAPERAWLEKYIHPDDREDVTSAVRRAIETRSVFELEHRVLRLDGTLGWTFSRAIPILDAGGEIVEWFGVAADVTERKRAELALRESEERSEQQRRLYEAILTNTPDLAYIFGLDHRFTYANEGLLAMWGRTWDEAIGKNCLELGYPDWHAAMHDREIEQVIATRQPIRGEVPFTGTFGRRIYDYIFVPVIGPDGEVEAVAGTTRDVTDLKEQAEALRESERREHEARREAERRAHATNAFTFGGDGMVVADRDGRIRSWNPAAERILGLPESALLGKRLEEGVEGWSAIAAKIPVAPAGVDDPPAPQALPIELAGREIWLLVSGTTFDGGTVYTFGDVSAEHALDRMRADLIATVSHELRTPLAAIYGAAATLRRRDLGLDESGREEFLAMIETQSARLATIVEEILLASKLDSGELSLTLEVVDPVSLAREVVESARVASGGPTIDLVAPEHAGTVETDGHKAAQVLRNLVDNAVRYSDGGSVDVVVERRDGRVRFAVVDRGIGIAPDDQRRVFEKFYRVDSAMSGGVGGTGLGLYICRELVRRMDGRIWVESEPGVGSTFAFELPADRGRR